MPNNNLKKLHANISKEYDLPDYDVFVADMEDEGKRKKLYDAVAVDYQLPDYNVFITDMGFGEKKNSVTPVLQPDSSNGGEPLVSEAQSTTSNLFKPLAFSEKILEVKNTPAENGKYAIQEGEQTKEITRDELLININNPDFLEKVKAGKVNVNIQDDEVVGNMFAENITNTPDPQPSKYSEEQINQIVDFYSNPSATQLLPDRLKQATNSFMSAIGQGVASIPKGIGILAKKLDFFDENVDKQSKDLVTYKVGQYIEDMTKEMFPTNPEYQDEFLTTVLPSGAGSIAGQIGSAFVNPALPVMLGSASMGAPEYEAALEATGDEEKAFDAWKWNAVIGTSEAILPMLAVSKINKATGGGITKVLKEGFQGSLTEGLQEAGSQMATNYTAQKIYDESRDILNDDVWKAGAAGFILGGFTTGTITALNRRIDSPETKPKEKIELQLTKEFIEKKSAEVQSEDYQPPKTEADVKINKIEEDIVNPDLPQEVKTVLSTELESLKIQKKEELNEKTDEEFEQFKSDKAEESVKALEESLPNVSEESKPVIENQIKELSKQIIEKTAIPEAETEGEIKTDSNEKTQETNKETDKILAEETGKEIEPHKEVKTDTETVIAELGLNQTDVVIYDKLKPLPTEERVGMLEVLSDEQDDNVREAEKKLDDIDDKKLDIDRALDDVDEDEAMPEKEKKKKTKELNKQYKELERQEKQLGKQIKGFEKAKEELDNLRLSDNPQEHIDDVITKVDARLETRKGVKLGYDLFPELANIPEFEPIKKEIQTSIDNGEITTEQVQQFAEQETELDEKVISDIESKSISDNEVELNEAIEEADKLIAEPAKEPKEKIEPFKEPTGKNLIAEGLDDLLSAIGGKADITGDKRKSVTDALIKIGNGLIQEGKATIDNVYEKIKEYLKANNIKLSDDDINDLEKDVVSVFKPREKVSGIKKALVSEEEIADIAIERRTVKQMLELGKELVDNGTINPQAITADIANGNARALQPNEVAALVYYKTQLDNKIDSVNRSLIKNQAQGNYEAELSDKAELAQLNQQLTDYHVMQVKTAYEQSLAFSLRKMLLDSEYNLQTQIEKYKAANGGVIPPDVEAKFRQLDADLKVANEKIKEFEAKQKEQKEAETIKNIKAEAQRKKRAKPSTVTIYGRQRVAKGFDDLASALGARTMAYGIKKPKITAALTEIGIGLIEEGVATAANVVEKIKEHVKIRFGDKIDFDEYQKDVEDNIKTRLSADVTQGKIKIPHQLLRDLVESGIDNIDDLTNAVKKELSNEYPDATERDIRDAITEYGKTVNPTQDDIEKQIRRMKRVGKLLSGIDDAREKKRPLRSGLQRDKLDAEERQLTKELKTLIKDLPMAQEDIEKKMKSDLDALKTRLKNSIEDLELRLKNKDFSDKPKKPLLDLDAEAIKLQAEANKIKEQFDLEHEKLKLSQRTKSEKFWDGLLDIIGLTKTMRTVMDMSAPFRQGLVFTTTRPVIAASAFKEMFKQAFSQERADNWMAHVKASPEYALMKASKLYLSEPTAKLTAREEAFMSNLIHQLPKYMKAKGVPKILRLPVEIYANLVRGSERAYTSYLNKMRVDVFLDTAEKFADLGIDPKTEEGAKVYKAWADYVNNATGRGDLGSFEQSSQALSTIFFSPKLIAARFNLLNPVRYASMPKEVRKEALKSTLGMISIGATAVALGALAGADVEDDWRSSDFMKMKIGNTRVDIWGGFQQWVRLLGQLVTGERKKATTGEVEALGGYGKDSRWTVLTDFFKNKFSPALALAVKFGESWIDEKTGKRRTKYDDLEITDELLDQTIPLYLADIDELTKEQGLAETGVLALLSFFGVGVQNYGQKQRNVILPSGTTTVDEISTQNITEQVIKEQTVETGE